MLPPQKFTRPSCWYCQEVQVHWFFVSVSYRTPYSVRLQSWWHFLCRLNESDSWGGIRFCGEEVCCHLLRSVPNHFELNSDVMSIFSSLFTLLSSLKTTNFFHVLYFRILSSFIQYAPICNNAVLLLNQDILNVNIALDYINTGSHTCTLVCN